MLSSPTLSEIVDQRASRQPTIVPFYGSILYYGLYNLEREPVMDALTYSYTRQHFADVMRQVNDDRAPVIVTSLRGRPVVIMSLDDYHAMEETAYLLRNPKGAKRLIEAIEELRSGGGESVELAGDD
jgi:antitoxin YefM